MGFRLSVRQCLLGNNVHGLQTFGALLDGELHLLAFLQAAETFTLDSGEVDENVRAAFASDEAVTFTIVEPFDRADDTFSLFICLLSKK